MESLVSVWLHETLRSYGDALADSKDRRQFEDLLVEGQKFAFPSVDASKVQ